MALKNLLLAFLSITVLADIGFAQVRTMPHGPGRPGPGYGPGYGPGHGGPHFPPPPRPNYPPPPPPPPPNYPPAPAPGNQEQRTAYLNRRVINERIQLLQLLQIGPRYNGYTVESVIVNLRGSNGQLDLLVNGGVQASLVNPYGSVRLAPFSGSRLGREIGNLELGVRGLADINAITINLRMDNNGGVGDVTVPLAINQRIFSGGRLDVSGFIDVNRYRGMRVVGIDINASSVYQSAQLTTLVNGQSVGAAWNLGPYATTFSVYPQYAIVGQYSDLLAFVANGDLNLNSVTLRLSR